MEPAGNTALKLDTTEIFKMIEELYNSLQFTSFFSMSPWLFLERLDPNGTIYVFRQFRGNYRSRAFDLGGIQLKEFTYLTPIRYYYNKKIFSNIEKLQRTGKYVMFLSFMSSYKLHITMYRIDSLHVKNFKIKLFSGSHDLSLFDWFTYLFKLSKTDRLKVKMDRLKKKIDRLEKQRNAEATLEDVNKSISETKKLIKALKKKMKKDREDEKKEEFKKTYLEQRDIYEQNPNDFDPKSVIYNRAIREDKKHDN